MRKIIESTLVSLDGVFGDPHRWATEYFDHECTGALVRSRRDADGETKLRVLCGGIPASVRRLWRKDQRDPQVRILKQFEGSEVEQLVHHQGRCCDRGADAAAASWQGPRYLRARTSVASVAAAPVGERAEALDSSVVRGIWRAPPSEKEPAAGSSS